MALPIALNFETFIPVERAYTEKAPAKSSSCSEDLECPCRDCKWIVEGYATLAGMDEHYKYVDPKALIGAKDDLLSFSTVLLNHEKSQPIGRVLATEYRPEPQALWVKTLVSKTAPDTWRKIQEGVLNKFSIKGNIINPVREWDKEHKREIVRANKEGSLKLYETSIVSIPAQAGAKCMAWYVERSLELFNTKPIPEGGERMAKEEIKRDGTAVAVSVEDLVGLVKSMSEIKDEFKQCAVSMLEGIDSILNEEDITPEDLRSLADSLESKPEELKQELGDENFEVLTRDFSPKELREEADNLEAAESLTPVMFEDAEGNLYDVNGEEWGLEEEGTPEGTEEEIEKSLSDFKAEIIDEVKKGVVEEIKRSGGKSAGIIRGLGSNGEARPQIAAELKDEEFDKLSPQQKLSHTLGLSIDAILSK